MKVVIIGNGGQSKKIQKILKRKRVSYDKPKQIIFRSECSNIFFITSPNTTHFYLKGKNIFL